MGSFGGDAAPGRLARLIGLGAAGLLLAHCSGGGSVDPKYGVKSSPRVVAAGQPVPKGGGVYKVGKPYTVAGRTYTPREDPSYNEVGLASWYGDDFHGRYTANGEIFDMSAISAASPTLPLPSYARVTNLDNNRSLVVRVNDRGPYVGDRIIDLSVRAAKLLGFHGRGLTRVRVEYVGRAPLSGSDDRKLAATLRDGAPSRTAQPVQVASARPSSAAATSSGYEAMYFDARPLSGIPAAQVPQPPTRPYAAAAASAEAPRAPERASSPGTEVAVAPLAPPQVSAFAPARYDGHTGAYLNGRGLY